jgi:hypothetical protein
MQQQCVYLHTYKDLDEAEKILRENGMTIILKQNSTYIDVSEMNEEEKRSYLETIKDEFAETLEEIGKAQVSGEMYFKSLQMMKTTIFEIFDLLDKTSNNQQVNEKFDLLLSEMRKVNAVIEVFDKIRNLRHSHIYVGHRPSCSMIIAKKGDEIIRYLEFERDPVITITGPNATNLKSSLESKF